MAKARKRKAKAIGAQPMGAPPVRNAANVAAIIARVRNGERVTTAAEAEGVSARTVSRWMADDSDGPGGDFCRTVAQARAQFLSDRLAIVAGAEVAVGRESDGSPILAPDPKYALALLERLDPEHYAPSQTIVLKAQDQAAADVLSTARECLPPEWYAVLVARLSGIDTDAGDEATTH